MTKRLVSMIIAILMIAALSISLVSAATDADLDTNQKVSVTLNCNKEGYAFEIFRIADLITGTNPYTVKYDVKVNDATVKAAVANGNYEAADSSKILDALDNDTELAGAVSVGTYTVDEDGSTKTFSDLSQGIYYVRAVDFPAGVISVANSCFALPYCTESGWVYSLDTINLATKIDDDEPEIFKEITNLPKATSVTLTFPSATPWILRSLPLSWA